MGLSVNLGGVTSQQVVNMIGQQSTSSRLYTQMTPQAGAIFTADRLMPDSLPYAIVSTGTATVAVLEVGV